MASDELSNKLQKRTNIIDAAEEGKELPSHQFKFVNVNTEFKEFSLKQIKHFQKMFDRFDVGKDKYIDLQELKLMMEKLEAPQTHLGLKAMIKEVDEDNDGKISFREFLLIFRKAEAGELSADSGLMDIYRQMDEVDVDKEGVKGAANFFAAKIQQQTNVSKFEEEIRAEKEEKRIEEEQRKMRKAAFKEKASLFS